LATCAASESRLTRRRPSHRRPSLPACHQVWDLRHGEALASVEIGQRVADLAFDARHVAVASADPAVHLYERPNWRARVLARHQRGLTCVAVSGDRIFSGSYDQTVKVWSV